MGQINRLYNFQAGLKAKSAEVDAEFDQLVSAHNEHDTNKANKTDVLTRSNVESFTPTTDYHPATKKYVDDTTAGVVLGQVPNGSIDEQKISSSVLNLINRKFDADGGYINGSGAIDLNTLTLKSEFYAVSNTAINKPSEVTSEYGFVWYWRHNNVYGVQYFFSSSSARMFQRFYNNGVFQPWVEMVNSNHLESQRLRTYMGVMM